MRVNTRSKVSIIAGLLLLIGHVDIAVASTDCSIAFNPSDHGSQFLRAQSLTAFNGSRYIKAVRGALDGEVMGYALSLRNTRGEEAITVEHGLARIPCEVAGGQDFTTRTVTGWGSVSKVISTAAVLHRIWHYEQSAGLDGSDIPPSPPAGVGPRIALETPFWSFLPLRWRSEVADGFHSVTFLQLLQHKAGFAQTDASFLDRLRLGPAQPAGKRVYSNAIGEIIQHLPHFFDPQTSRLAEMKFSWSSNGDYHAAMADLSWRVYQDYVQTELLAPIGIAASCNDLQGHGENYALFYAGAMDRRHGHNIHLDDRTACGASGWTMSTRDMSWFLHQLTSGDTLIPKRFYEKMAYRSAVDDRLGWATASSMDGGYAFHSNGVMDYSDGTAMRTLVVHYPNGYVVAIATNSKLTDTTPSLEQILFTAYKSARGLE